MNKKIVHVLRNDALGGVENSTLEIVKYFLSQGIQQEVVILSSLANGVSSYFIKENVSTTSIPFSKTQLLKFVVAYWVYMQKSKPDIQLVSGVFGLHALLNILARLAGVKRCWTYLVMKPPGKGLSYFVQYFLSQLSRLFSSGEISVSNYLKYEFHQLMKLPLKNIHVIHRWRDIAAISEEAELARQRRDSMSPVIITISRLDWMKDLPNLINAFAIFVKTEPEAIFYIVGDGPMKIQLEKQVERLGILESVKFLGHRSDISNLLGGGDIFIFSTSQTEGIGGVMIEAMAAGIPIVCTDVGPCQEVLNNGEGGIIVPIGNPQFIAAAMLDLWKDPNKRKELSKRANKLAADRYSKERCGKELINLLFESN